MTVDGHTENRWSIVGLVIEQDTHDCGLSVRRHVEYVPACGLTGTGILSEVGSTVIAHFHCIKRIVAKVTVCERSVEGDIVPDKRMSSLGL